MNELQFIRFKAFKYRKKTWRILLAAWLPATRCFFPAYLFFIKRFKHRGFGNQGGHFSCLKSSSSIIFAASFRLLAFALLIPGLIKANVKSSGSNEK